MLYGGGVYPNSIIGGKTLLHHFCAAPLLHYYRRVVESPPTMAGLSLLLDAGVNPNASSNGETACTLLQHGHPERHKHLVERLLVYGAESLH